MPGPIIRELVAAARTLHRLPARLANLEATIDRLLDRLETMPPADITPARRPAATPLDIFDRAHR